jgi:hypothetical protein
LRDKGQGIQRMAVTVLGEIHLFPDLSLPTV